MGGYQTLGEVPDIGWGCLSERHVYPSPGTIFSPDPSLWRRRSSAILRHNMDLEVLGNAMPLPLEHQAIGTMPGGIGERQAF